MINSVFGPFRWARAIGLVLILAFSPLMSPGQVPAPGQALQAPPYQWARSHDYDVQHYRIVLSFDWAKKSISGETTITLRPFKSDVKEIILDAGDMTISSVKLGQGVPLKFRYEGNEKLFVALDRAYPAGYDLTLTVSYSATPKKGLTFITPTETEPDRPYQIWSQGESQDNHYWFPCYDYPNDKATSDLIATVPDRYQVISNGFLVNVQADPVRKTKTWHWKMDKPFSSYLVSIIVGEFQEIKDQFKTVPVISYVYRDQTENARLSFAKTPKMVAFFSQKIGLDYPYPKYAQTTVRDFGGGMENITATTLTDMAIYDRRALIDASADGLVSHELAHSWFGDLLTCRDWGELWLNEGFATFFANLWTEQDKGKDDYLYEMLGNQQGYFQAWHQGIRRPIVTKRYGDSDSVFDAYAYPRGAAVLGMLRFVLGEELFWKGLSHYVRKHEWQNVETAQLVVAIEEATGQDLQWFFDEWVYKMGHPEFEISSSYDEAAKTLKLSVKQTQKPDEKRPWFQSPDFFTTPVDVAITTASGETIHRVSIDKVEQEFTFPVDSKPLIVNFDRGNYLIKQVKFNRSDEEIGYQLLHDQDVMGRVRAAIELKSHHSDSATRALAEAAVRDPFWAVRIEATKSLSELKTDASRAALLEVVKDKDSRLRRAAIQGLAAFKDPKLADLYVNILNNEQSYFAVSEAARALGKSGAAQAYDVLVGLLKQDSWHDMIRAGAMGGLAALKDPRTLDIALEYARPGRQPAVRGEAFELLGEVGKGDDRAREALIATLKERPQRIILGAVQALGKLGDSRAVAALEEFAKQPNLPHFARQTASDVINKLKNPTKEGEKKD